MNNSTVDILTTFTPKLMSIFMTIFIQQPCIDLGQDHDIENFMIWAIVLILDKAMTLARDIDFAICLADVMVSPTRLVIAMPCP